MFKSIKIISCCFLGTSNIGVIATKVVNNAFKEIKNQISVWDNSNYKFYNSFIKNDEVYKIYKVSDNNVNKGYFIFNNDKLITFYVGNYEDSILNEYEKLSPIFGEGELIEDEISLISNSTTQYHNPPKLNVNLYKTESSSMHSEQLIKDCPYYYDSPYITISNGCAPITGAMLVSFYDRYSDLTNLVNGELPLNHGDDILHVNELIYTLSNLMNHDDTGTEIKNAIKGIETYFSIKGYSKYKMNYLNSYDEYSYFIRNYKNPTYLRIDVPNSDIKHAVLGIGCANLRETGRYMVTHYGWASGNKGDYYVTEDLFLGAFYLGEN